MTTSVRMLLVAAITLALYTALLAYAVPGAPCQPDEVAMWSAESGAHDLCVPLLEPIRIIVGGTA